MNHTDIIRHIASESAAAHQIPFPPNRAVKITMLITRVTSPRPKDIVTAVPDFSIAVKYPAAATL